MGYLHQHGTECLIVDDAHDLSLEHLMFIKEETDQGRLQYDHPLGLCLVAAGRGNTIPLKWRFLSNSGSFRKAPPDWWIAPTVGHCAPLNHMVESCGSSLTTNAKRRLPIPDNDGPEGKRTGTWRMDKPMIDPHDGANLQNVDGRIQIQSAFPCHVHANAHDWRQMLSCLRAKSALLVGQLLRVKHRI
jgi:hypothetical protein